MLLKLFALLALPALLNAAAVKAATAEDLERRLADLENKVQVLEKAVTDKLGACSLNFKIHAVRLNVCDKGTFARSVTNVGSNAYQLECGYYQLQCEK